MALSGNKQVKWVQLGEMGVGKIALAHFSHAWLTLMCQLVLVLAPPPNTTTENHW